MMQGTGKADWQKVFSDEIDPPAQAGTREEVGNKKNEDDGFESHHGKVFSLLQILMILSS